MKGPQRVSVVQSRHSKAQVSKNVLLKKNYMSFASHIFQGQADAELFFLVLTPELWDFFSQTEILKDPSEK